MLRQVCLLVCFVSLLPTLGFAQSPALHRILQHHTEVYGGLRDAGALTSLSVEGTIELGGQSYDFMVRKKRPDLMRYHLSLGSNQIIVGFDGESGWMRNRANGGTEVTVLDEAGTRALREHARFDSPLFRHTEKPENKLRLLEHSVYEGTNVHVVEVRRADGRVSHYYLDEASALILRHDDLDADGEVTFQTLYRDYRNIGGFPFAHQVEYRSGSGTVSLAEVRTVEVNPGILSFYFEKPER